MEARRAGSFRAGGGAEFREQARLNPGPDGFAGVVRVEFGELAENLAGALVVDLRNGYFDGYDLVSARTFVGSGGNAAIAHAKLLAALRTRRNAKLGAAVDGGDIDAAAERGFRDGDGQRDVNVVRSTREDGMRTAADDEVQIAGRSAMEPGVAFAGEADALASRVPGLMRNSRGSVR